MQVKVSIFQSRSVAHAGRQVVDEWSQNRGKKTSLRAALRTSQNHDMRCVPRRHQLHIQTRGQMRRLPATSSQNLLVVSFLFLLFSELEIEIFV